MLDFQHDRATEWTAWHVLDDGTGRMDFDLSEVDNEVLRGLDAGVNEIIRHRADVRSVYVDADGAATVAGLVCSLSVAPPPTPDGRLRVIDIDGVNCQACGGTHLANTAQLRPFRITKVESKGKRKRPHPLRARAGLNNIAMSDEWPDGAHRSSPDAATRRDERSASHDHSSLIA
ncbi:MAG: hypothetical protein ACR2HQ_14645 [Ilumatobacteraceae bacterium]